MIYNLYNLNNNGVHMKFYSKYEGKRETLNRFAILPKTLLNKNTLETETVWLESYKVVVEYRTSTSLLSYILSTDKGFTRYMVCNELYFI